VSTKVALNGMFWNGAESFFLQIFQLLVSMILARLLSAADFGLIALISVFIAVANTIAQGGFRATIIMRTNLGEIDYSTAFIYNLAVAVFLYLVMFISAPVIAAFYAEPALVKLVRILGLVNILNAGYFVQDALLQKSMRFKVLAQRNIAASFISGCLAIVLAYLGFGVWSLVSLTISRAVIINLYLWLMRVWRFSLRFSWESFKRNFSFGSRMMITNITGVIFGNLNNLLIGKFYSKADLGYFYQAQKIKALPIDSVCGIITKTSTPMLAKDQNDFPSMHKTYANVTRIAALCVIPITVFLFVFSRELIVLLFSAKWLASVPIFRIIIIAGLFAPFIVINGQAPAIMGDSKFYLRYDTALKLLMLAVSFIALRFGLYVFIASQTTLAAVQMVINAFIARKYFKVGIMMQLMVFLPYLLYSAVAGIAAFLLIWLTDLIPIALLGLGSMVFLIVFIIQVYFFERKTYDDVLRLVRMQRARLLAKKAPGIQNV